MDLAQYAEHGLGPIRVVVRRCALGIGIEGGMVAAGFSVLAAETNVVEPLNEKGLLGILENELRPFFARPDGDPFERLELLLSRRCAPSDA